MSEKAESSTTGSRPGSRRARTLRIVTASLVLAGVVGYLATQHQTSEPGPARCVVTAAGGKDGGTATYELLPEQAANAATIEAVASSRRLPERAVTIALATAMQESSLRNIDYGDRDSVGLFQQRPSQGWGSPKQIMDPVYSAGKFYEYLVEVPGYSRLPLTVAAQKVQRSGFPQAYAKHEGNASLLTAALTGRRAAALTCTTGPGGLPDGAGDPAEVKRRLTREFGPDVLKGEGDTEAAGREDRREGRGNAPEKPSRGAERGEGPGAEVVLPAATPERGWELAHWAVAHARQLRVDRIAYDGRVWTSGRSEEGWRTEGRGTDGLVRRSAVVLRMASGA